MGAWGHGHFENDDAMDFLADLAEVPVDVPSTLRERLEAATAGEYIDAPDGAEAQAAAAIVSAARPGSPVDRSDGNVDEYLTAITPHVPADLGPLAVEAIDGLLGSESELVDLWDEAGELDAFRGDLLAVREHLTA